MILALVNDPDRVPTHWTDLIRPGQFAVFVFDARGHQPRDPGGGVPAHATPSIALCESMAEAKAFANRLVAEHPELCCEIYDHEDEYGQPLSAIYDAAFRDKYLGRGAARRTTIWGGVLLLCGTVFVAIDFQHDLAWLWGYIIGLKCLVVGTSLVVNGLSGFHATANSKTSKESRPRPATHP